MDKLSNSNYKKYLKYKKKYLELKQKMKGGDLPCIIPIDQENSNDISSFIRVQGLYDVFYMAYYLYKNIRYTVPTGGYIRQIAGVYKILEDAGAKLNYGEPPLARITIEIPARPSSTDADMELENEIKNLTKTNVLNVCNELNIFPQINDLLNPSNINIGLLESVLGSTLNISCNNELQAKFENIINTTETQTYIIDYQNILHKLIRDEATIPLPAGIDITQRNNYHKFRAVARIKQFVNAKITVGNLVIIIYKPSGIFNQAGQTSSPPDSIVDIHTGVVTRDLLLESFFRTDSTYDLQLADEPTWNLNINNALNNNLYIVNYFMPTNPTNSSYDDLMFWLLGICFYKIYERFGKIQNIFLMTNDKQRLIDPALNTIPVGPITNETIINHLSPFSLVYTQFKNVLDLGPAFNNVCRIKYELDDHGIVSARALMADNIRDNLLTNYLSLMYDGCDHFVNTAGQLISASTLNGNDIYNTIFATRFFINDVESSIMGNLLDSVMTLNPSLTTIPPFPRQVYTIPYYFYAHIKYIQYKKFGDFNGSYTDAEIIDTFGPV